MDLMSECLKKLKEEEDYKQHPYYCTAKKLTIGYGRNLDDRGISEKEAEYLLKNDIIEAQECLSENFDFYENLNESQQLALIDMVINMGFPKFCKFKKMIAALKQGDYQKARLEMLDSNYATQVRRRALRNSDLILG